MFFAKILEQNSLHRCVKKSELRCIMYFAAGAMMEKGET